MCCTVYVWTILVYKLVPRGWKFRGVVWVYTVFVQTKYFTPSYTVSELEQKVKLLLM